MIIEKPELFPAYAYLQSPDVNAVRLRGKAFFDFMARTVPVNESPEALDKYIAAIDELLQPDEEAHS